MNRLTPRFLAGLSVGLLLVGTILIVIKDVYGDQQLSQRSLQLSTSQAGATASYKLGFTIITPASLGSIRAQFCSNNPLIGAACTAPVGFDISHATLTSQSGETGFSISGSTTANVLILTRPAASSLAQPVSYTLDGVINPTDIGSYYVRLQTFSSTDASGPDIDYGGIALSTANVVTINAEVPPSLEFCAGVTISSFSCTSASGDYIDLGELSASHTSQSTSQFMVATNAANGYSVTDDGTSLTSGNNVISPVTSLDISRSGTNQFGINLRTNVDPNVGLDPIGPGTGTPSPSYGIPNFYRFVPGDILASSTGVEDHRKYTVSYIVNVAKTQPAGVYATTLTYVCLANF